MIGVAFHNNLSPSGKFPVPRTYAKYKMFLTITHSFQFNLKRKIDLKLVLFSYAFIRLLFEQLIGLLCPERAKCMEKNPTQWRVHKIS